MRSADYSYATCSTLSSYATDMLFKSVAGNVVKVAIAPFAPFIVAREEGHEDIKTRYGGAEDEGMESFFRKVFNKYLLICPVFLLRCHPFAFDIGLKLADHSAKCLKTRSEGT